MDVEKEILEIYDRMQKLVDSRLMQAQTIGIQTTTIRLLTDRVAELESNVVKSAKPVKVIIVEEK